MLRHVLVLAFCLFSIITAAASNPFPHSVVYAQTAASPSRSSSTAAVPSPQSVLGFLPGTERTIADWQQITGYFERLDRASDRVLMRNIGETTLKRPLVVAFISAGENIQNLNQYQDVQRRLADPRLIANDAERDGFISRGKTVVAISCSIHSTEIVASQMSMQLAYDLAIATDPETIEILQNTILMLIPSANPDGVDIIANWYRQTLGTAHEGTEPPELYHHYAGHDNNRDWFMLNLKESQAITRLFWKEWFPQIVYDVHQQGATGSRFFIPPFYDPPNPHIAPLLLREVGLIGHKIAADLQAKNVSGVITNAMYDTWWHGGFRTAPYYHNAVGILSEAASARLMSPITVTKDQLAKATTRGMSSALQPATNFPEPWTGGEWRPNDIMNIELSAARSVLGMAAKYRTNYLRNFYNLGRQALSYQPSANQPSAYLIPAGQGLDENVAKMIDLLVRQGVEVHRMDRELHVQPVNAENAAKQAASSQVSSPQASRPNETPAGSYVVFLAQPYRMNVQALFERQVYPERRTANGEAERPYDVTGWTLPMQMGIEVVPIASITEPVSERRLTLVKDALEVRRDLGLPVQTSPNQVSPLANPITRPVRLALYKSYTNSMDEGWTRFVFDTFNVPYQSLLDEAVRAGNLRARFDVIVLPSQRMKDIVEGRLTKDYPEKFAGGITERGVANLREFVEAGGTLICFDASAELAVKRFDLPLRNVLEGVRSSDFYCPGSILRIEVDRAHQIARGLKQEIDAYFINSSAFDVTDPQRVRVVARYAAKDVLQSGYLLGENRIAGKAALVEVGIGKGRVVIFGFRPQHRGQTWGTFPFIFNAIQSN